MKELEQIILGRCLASHLDTPRVFSILTVEDFRNYPREAQILKQSWEENVVFGTRLVTSGISTGDFLVEDYTSDTTQLAESLKRQNAVQDVKNAINQFSKKVSTDNLEGSVNEVQMQLLNAITKTKKEDFDIDNVITEFIAYQQLYAEKNKSGQKLLGKSTGFDKLDEIIDGLRDGHLWILGGYTNLGKTYAALNIVSNFIKSGERCIFYSLEMTKVDILARILGIMTEQNGNVIVKTGGDKEKVNQASKKVSESKLSIFKDKNDISEIVFSIQEECVRNKPALIVLDFLQLVQCKSAKSEYEATTTAILELQKAAQRYEVPIIVLSQVSNESAKNGDQQVMGFKGSGGIAAAADLAIELVSGEESITELRVKMNKGEPVKIKWHIKKNRHGRVGTIMTKFTGFIGKFEEDEDY